MKDLLNVVPSILREDVVSGKICPPLSWEMNYENPIEPPVLKISLLGVDVRWGVVKKNEAIAVPFNMCWKSEGCTLGIRERGILETISYYFVAKNERGVAKADQKAMERVSEMYDVKTKFIVRGHTCVIWNGNEESPEYQVVWHFLLYKPPLD